MSSPFPVWHRWAVHSTRNGVPPEPPPAEGSDSTPPVEEPTADVPRETPPEPEGDSPPPAAAKKRR